jgi:cytochrome P450
MGAANVDRDVFPDSMTVDFDRKLNPHIAFGVGAHRCSGSHMARRELNVGLWEWNRRLPGWSLRPGTDLKSTMPIRMVDDLELVGDQRRLAGIDPRPPCNCSKGK